MLDASALEVLKAALVAATPQAWGEQPFKPAAVLLLLSSDGDGLEIVFTKRTSRVEHHKGEVSFPGGACDPEDKDPCATALRETHEEIGVPPDQVQVLGRLPTAVTRTNFAIFPFVGLLVGPRHYAPNPREVEELFTVPLSWLLDPANRREESLQHNGHLVTAYAYYYGGHRIWGATARILTSFLDVVVQLGRQEHSWTTVSATSQR